MNKADFKVGDQVKVITKDLEQTKAHSTFFEGMVIALRGDADNKTFTVRKNASDGVYVERIFPLGSPLIEKINVVKSNKVRRAKLYYLRKK